MVNGIGHIGDDPRVTGLRQKQVEKPAATFNVEALAPPTPVPMAPPPEVLQALDSAARVLNGLDKRGDELRLSVEPDGVKATLQPVDGGVQELTHRQLLDLLAGR
jgi:hypothetical protein